MLSNNEKQAILAEWLIYDPATGVVRWRKNSGSRGVAGRPAGTLDDDGYINIKVRGLHIRAHRVASYLMTGDCPDVVDHRDVNTANNRWDNIRAATTSTNQMNRGANENNSLGVKGVSLVGAKYRAKLCNQHIGYYDTIELAAAAYDAEATRVYGEYAYTNGGNNAA